ncbi:hypothetical protein ACVSNS_01505 [Pseudomonas aeruginosa]
MKLSLQTLSFAFGLFIFSNSTLANPAQAVTTLKKGIDIMELHEAIVQNPNQLLFLATNIEATFRSNPTGYKDLSNEYAESVNWFANGTKGRDQITLQPETSSDFEYGFYSIELQGLDFKECQTLTRHPLLTDVFENIKVNGTAQGGAKACKSLSSGNIIKFIGR